MRKTIALLGCTALAACGGGEGAGPTSPGSVAIGSGTSTNTGQGTSSDAMPTLANPGRATTYVGVGGEQVYQYSTYAAPNPDLATNPNAPEFVPSDGTQQKQIYAGSTSTVRSTTSSIAYDPTDATFTLKVTDPLSGASTNSRFQDPANRTDFLGAKVPQPGAPDINSARAAAGEQNLGNVHYLQSGDGNPLSPITGSGSGITYTIDGQPQPVGDPGANLSRTTFFYQVPGTANAAGTTTNYVTFAGYMRNAYSWATQTRGSQAYLETQSVLERGAFAYGTVSDNDDVPTTGTGTYYGGMVATAVLNPTLDTTGLPSYFQWIQGTSTTVVDFGAKTVNFSAQGTVFAPQGDNFTLPNPPQGAIQAGASFAAAGSGTIDLVRSGGFQGQMSSATITNPGSSAPDINLTTANGQLAGSTLTGAFYGPGKTIAATEVGGGFRAVGGNPDQRVDIVGSFAGAVRP